MGTDAREIAEPVCCEGQIRYMPGVGSGTLSTETTTPPESKQLHKRTQGQVAAGVFLHVTEVKNRNEAAHTHQILVANTLRAMAPP